MATESESSSSIFYNGTFSEFDLNPKLIESINVRLGHEKPTMVQSKAIPEILAKKDVLVKANTGSGKTLAYLIPIVNLLLQIKVDRSEGTYALIIAPTRELCLQIYTVLRKLIEPFPYLVPGNLMGGEKKKSEKARLRKGVTFLVGTPGRLLDHLETTNCFQVNNLKWLILDEADMLLELGFEKSVKRIIAMLDEKKDLTKGGRQSGLFSATLHKGVQRLAAVTLNTHSYIEADDVPMGDAAQETEDGFADKSYQTPATLNQKYVIVETKRRLLTLFFFAFCRIKEDQKVVIFVSNISAVEFLHSLFARLELPTYDGAISLEEGKSLFKLHGDMSQVDRTKIYFSFGKAKSAILVCTDVAARGLDLPRINWIVQFDPPSTNSEYIHRVGRTARKGEEGNSLIFLLQNEANYVQVLESHKLTLSEISVDEIYAEAFDSRHVKTHPMDFVFSMQKNIETLLQENKDLENQAREAYTSSIRAYATHSHKSVFSIRSIHLGHFASSFGLLEAPTQIGRNSEKNHNFLKGPNKSIGKNSQIKGRGSRKLGVQKWLQNEMKKKEVRAQIRDSSTDSYPSVRNRHIQDEFSAGF